MIVSCEQCKKEFNKRPSKIEVCKQHFCSPGCHQEYRNEIRNVFDYFIGTASRSLRRKSKERNLEFTITAQDLEEVWIAQNGKCNLTGEDLSLGCHDKDSSRTASLDRIDSSIGYVKSNIQWLHKHVNNMKQQYDQSYFISLCCKVANHCRMWFY